MISNGVAECGFSSTAKTEDLTPTVVSDAASSLIVFLDFDGTMHPVQSDVDKIFQHAGLLATWLDEHPTVQLVVSSSWREQYTLSELRDLLFHDRPELQDRVVGATPILKFIGGLEGCERDAECRLWLYDSEEDHDYAAWVAIDDQPELFSSLSAQRLVLCNSSEGLTERVLDEAWQLLERFSSVASERRSSKERAWEPLIFSQDSTVKRRPLPDERVLMHEMSNDSVLTQAEAVNQGIADPRAGDVDEQAASAGAKRRSTWTRLPKNQQWVTVRPGRRSLRCSTRHCAGLVRGASAR